MFHGYLIVLATFVLKFVGIGMEFSGAIFLIPFQATFNSSRAEASMVESIYCSTGLLVSMAAGTLQSYFANYYGEVSSIKPVIAMGGFCISLGSYLISTAEGIVPVLLYAVITGIGIGLTGYTSPGICIQFFNRRNRGQMLLLGSCGSGCGSFALTKIMGFMLAKYASYYGEEAWRVVIRRVGVFCGLVAISASFIMRLPYPLEVEMHEDGYDSQKDDVMSRRELGSTVANSEEEEEEEEVKIQNNNETSSLLLHPQMQQGKSERFYDTIDSLRDSTIDSEISGNTSLHAESTRRDESVLIQLEHLDPEREDQKSVEVEAGDSLQINRERITDAEAQTAGKDDFQQNSFDFESKIDSDEEQILEVCISKAIMKSDGFHYRNKLITSENNRSIRALVTKHTISHEMKPLEDNQIGNRSDDCTLSFVSNGSIVEVSFLNNISSILQHGSGAASHPKLFSLKESLAGFESERGLPIDRISIMQSASTNFETNLSLTRVIRTRTSVSVFGTGFFLSFGLMALLQHLPAFAKSIGLEEEQGTRILSWAGLTMIIGNIGFGFVEDCIGPIQLLRLLLFTLTCLIFAWPYCYNEITLRLLALIYGGCLIVSFNLPLVIFANAFGTASPTAILHLSGLLNVITVPGYLLGPAIVGYLYDLFGNYRTGSIFAGTSLLLSFISICFCLHPDEQKRRLGIY